MTKFFPIALGAALLGWAAPHAQAKSPAKSSAKPVAKTKTQNITVTADGSGYSPSVINVKAGVPVRMVFVSKGTGCTNSVVIPALNKKFRLKMGQKQAVSFTPKKGQSITFACSMDMFHGKVQAK